LVIKSERRWFAYEGFAETGGAEFVGKGSPLPFVDDP